MWVRIPKTLPNHAFMSFGNIIDQSIKSIKNILVYYFNEPQLAGLREP